MVNAIIAHSKSLGAELGAFEESAKQCFLVISFNIQNIYSIFKCSQII